MSESISKESIEDLLKQLDEQNEIFIKNNFILDVLKDCLDSGTIENPLNEKIHTKVVANRVAQSIKLNSGGISTSLFGLEDDRGPALSFKEKSVLQDAFLKKLCNYEEEDIKLTPHKIPNYLQTNTPLSTVEENCENLINARENLNKLISTYSRNLFEYSERLNEIVNLRCVKILKMCEEKYEETKLKSNIAKCKKDCLDQRVKYKAIGASKVAYDILIEDMTKQQMELEKDIKSLEKLKENYLLVESMEYNEILKSYAGYLKDIDYLKSKCNK